jgi:hypothetical protein
MAGFGVGDIVLAGEYAYSVYKSSKNAGEDFKAITLDGMWVLDRIKLGENTYPGVIVKSLQSHLRTLNIEFASPTSLVHRASLAQQRELQALAQDCKSDLRDLKQLLSRYNSLQTSNPRMRDKLTFTASKQLEIKAKIITHTERLNRFLSGLQVGALARIEGHVERHTVSFEDIKRRLDVIHNEVLAGKRDASIFTDRNGSVLEHELLDDDITEIDVEINKREISSWLTQVRTSGDINTVSQSVSDKMGLAAGDSDLESSGNQEGGKVHGPWVGSTDTCSSPTIDEYSTPETDSDCASSVSTQTPTCEISGNTHRSSSAGPSEDARIMLEGPDSHLIQGEDIIPDQPSNGHASHRRTDGNSVETVDEGLPALNAEEKKNIYNLDISDLRNKNNKGKPFQNEMWPINNTLPPVLEPHYSTIVPTRAQLKSGMFHKQSKSGSLKFTSKAVLTLDLLIPLEDICSDTVQKFKLTRKCNHANTNDPLIVTHDFYVSIRKGFEADHTKMFVGMGNQTGSYIQDLHFKIRMVCDHRRLKTENQPANQSAAGSSHVFTKN